MITGAFKELEELRKRVAFIASPEFRYELCNELADEAQKQAQAGFDRGVDPYDVPWAPLTYRSGKPLVDEGHLERAITGPQAKTVTPQGFVISTRGMRTFPSVANAMTHFRGRTINAKTAKGMRFRYGGTSRTNGPNWARAQSVTIPKRQFMPEGTMGSRWTAGFDARANRLMRRTMGQPWGAR